jgi:DNA-binding response OmpR family regulator
MPNLLVVDDEPSILESLEFYFSSQGHQIQTASGLPQALELAEKMKPDAIVSDLMFEGGTGLMLREELSRRHQGWDPGFIIMSGRATLETALEAMRQGVDEFLLKPLNLEHLNLALESALQKRRKINQDLKIKFQLAEKFYHDLSLPLNLLLPRLCMLLEGRNGSLSISQVQSLSGQFEYLREILWVMKGFYPRLLEGHSLEIKRSALEANRLIADILAKLEPELYQREISLNFQIGEESKILANRGVAESIVEIVVTRALTIAERGAQLKLTWNREGGLLFLKLELITSAQSSHTKTIAPLIQLVPLSLSCLELCGISFDCENPAGPWRIGFDIARE